MVALAKLVPSLRSLLIFELVARSGSCSAAAREFNLTQPSASRNIAQLEAHLGVPLFTRSAAGMELTREGQILYQALGDGFHRVEVALNHLSALRDAKDVVELSLSTAFVTHWLVPRLPALPPGLPVGRPALPADPQQPARRAGHGRSRHAHEGRARRRLPQLAFRARADHPGVQPELPGAAQAAAGRARASPVIPCCTCRTRISIRRRCGAPRRRRSPTMHCWSSATMPSCCRRR